MGKLESMHVHQTTRLTLRRFTLADAPFILTLVNEPAFIANIGDKDVRNLADARQYLEKAPLESYARYGFGLYAVELRETGELIGMCGLLKRDTLDHPDIGFAFLERHWSKGYAAEAAQVVLAHARESLRLPRVLAITTLTNDASGRVLEKCGLTFDKVVTFANQHESLRLYSTRWAPVAL